MRGEQEALEHIPAMGRLLAKPEELRARAKRLARRLAAIGGPWTIDVAAANSQAGSGSLPARDLPTTAVRVLAAESAGVNGGGQTASGAGGATQSALLLARELRTGEPAILARVHDEAVLLDPRTIEDSEFALIEARFRELAAGNGAGGGGNSRDT